MATQEGPSTPGVSHIPARATSSASQARGRRAAGRGGAAVRLPEAGVAEAPARGGPRRCRRERRGSGGGGRQAPSGAAGGIAARGTRQRALFAV